MLVERDYFAQRLRCQPFRENGVGRAVALEGAVWNLKGRNSVRRHFLGCFSKRQGLRLGEEVGHQEIAVTSKGVQRLAEADEVAGDQLGSLVNELVEGVLAIGSRLSPDYGPGLIVHLPAFQVDVFSVALHIELLEVGRQAAKVIIIRQNRHGLGTEEVVVPDAYESQEHRQVALKRRRAKMLVHRVETGEHLAKLLGANSDHQGKADG